MKKWHVIGFNECSNAGTFEAETAEQAEEIAWNELTLTNCHACPDTSGDPYFIVSDEDHNVVLDGSHQAARDKEIADLKEQLAAFQSKYDELKWRMDGLEK